MKKINIIFKLFLVVATFSLIGCEQEEYKLGNIKAPSGVSIMEMELE